MLTFKEGVVYNDLPLLKRCLQKASRFPLSTQRLEFSAGTPYTKKSSMSQWSKTLSEMNFFIISLNDLTYVTLDQNISLKSLGYICSNRQKYIVWVQIKNY